MPYDWHSFLPPADEWLVAYSTPPAHLTSVKLFSVGHAFELYLKACHTKMTGDIDEAMSFSHRILDIWRGCKSADEGFLPDFELRESVLACDLLAVARIQPNQLSDDDMKHFLHYQELYIVFQQLGNLKYLGAPLKPPQGPWAFGTVFPNPMWAKIFRDLRLYLEYPEADRTDLIRYHIESSELPPISVDFLTQILGKSTT